MRKLLKKLKDCIRNGNVSNKYSISKQAGLNREKKIVYILHSDHHKSGGDKVIYKQSQLISELMPYGFSSEVLHVENLNFKHDWFEHNVKFRKELSFDPDADIVILPEIWVHPHADKLKELGIKYAIFVQNPYLLNVPMEVFPDQNIDDAYKNAALILSISVDTTECLRLAFPECAEKIIQISCSVDSSKFKSDLKKENLITYMPRKLAKHSKLVLFFLRSQLPANWRIEPINGLSESDVALLLARSKIFLSFSEFEGLGLPPIEAALSHNYVIGYTGEGGAEYWDSPIFTEVKPGNMRDFVSKVIQKINKLDFDGFSEVISAQNLAQKYSKQNELESIKNFVYAVDKVMSNKKSST